ncbi:MAG: hypothetical protein AABX05_04580, partial [Nanoarchaeota archaeon]
SGESSTNSIEVTIPTSATTGSFTVVANSSGINSSGADLGNASLVFGDTVSVTVSSVTGTLGGASTGGAASSTTTTAASVSAGGGGGGGKVTKSLTTQKQVIETTQVFTVPRGSGASTPISVANLWENAVLKNIHLSVTGFLSQYVVVSPEINSRQSAEITATLKTPYKFSLPSIGEHTITIDEIKVGKVTITLASTPQTLTLQDGQARYIDLTCDKIGDLAIQLNRIIGEEAVITAYGVKDFSSLQLAPGEFLNYSVDVYAPSYLVQQDYQLRLQIDALLIPLNSTLAGFSQKEIIEYRTLLFRVRELSREEAADQLEKARRWISEMSNASFNVDKDRDYLIQAEEALNSEEFVLLSDLVSKIELDYKNSFAANQMIIELQQNLEKLQARWLSAPRTEEALALAQIAFQRGDYALALERAKNAQLIFVLETKGRINLIKFIMDWWWALLLALVVLSILTYFTYKKSYGLIIEQRIKNINKEEETIQSLMEEAQKKYLQEGGMSKDQYQRYLDDQEKRLASIRHLRIRLRNKKVGLLKAEQELNSVKTEKEEVLGLMKKNQQEYLVDKNISRNKFKDKEELHKERLTELEHEEELLTDKQSYREGRKRNVIIGLFARLKGHLLNPHSRKKKDDSSIKQEAKSKSSEKDEDLVDETPLKNMLKAIPSKIVVRQGSARTDIKKGPRKAILNKPFQFHKPAAEKLSEKQPEKRLEQAQEKPLTWKAYKKQEHDLPDSFAGKWIKIKVPQEGSAQNPVLPEKAKDKKVAPKEEPKRKIKITNTPENNSKRMSEKELRKLFPGAFK